MSAVGHERSHDVLGFSFTVRRAFSKLYKEPNEIVVFLDIYGAVTRMEEAQRSQASRRGHRAHLTKLLKRTEEIMANENPSEMDMAVLRSAIEQLQKKKALLQELDAKINATIEGPDELENEIITAEDIQSDIIDRICQVNKFYELKQTLPVHQPHTEASHLPAHSSHTDPQEESQLQASPQQVTPIQNAQPQQVHTQNQNAQPQQVNTQNQNVQPPQVQSLNPPPSTPHQHVNIEVPTAALNTPTTQSQSRLPKLSLPTFNGNPLQWQTFWDSFKAAVHSRPKLVEMLQEPSVGSP